MDIHSIENSNGQVASFYRKWDSKEWTESLSELYDLHMHLVNYYRLATNTDDKPDVQSLFSYFKRLLDVDVAVEHTTTFLLRVARFLERNKRGMFYPGAIQVSDLQTRRYDKPCTHCGNEHWSYRHPVFICTHCGAYA
ncbi:MAG: hypothetical protein WCX83_05610 [Candidatus Cloacimonas sp.]